MPEPTRHRSCAAAGRAVARICRQWTGGKTGVPVAAALLAALWLLPALQPVLASPPRVAQYEAYPAVRWQDATAAETYELRRAVYGSGNLDSLQAVWAKTQPESLPPTAFDVYSWSSVQLPTAIGRALRNVQFFRQAGGLWGSWPRVEAIALYDGRLYRLQSLNKLLADVGFKFDTSEVKTVAKIAVLWTLMQRQAKHHQPPGDDFGERSGPGPDSAALATAIPAVTFRKIGPSKVQLDGLPARTIEVQCAVDGEPVTFHLSLRSGKYPMRLHGFGRQLMFFDAPPLRRSAIGLTREIGDATRFLDRRALGVRLMRG